MPNSRPASAQLQRIAAPSSRRPAPLHVLSPYERRRLAAVERALYTAIVHPAPKAGPSRRPQVVCVAWRMRHMADQLRRVGELRQAQPRVLWLARGHKVDLGARPLVQPRPYDAPG